VVEFKVHPSGKRSTFTKTLKTSLLFHQFLWCHLTSWGDAAFVAMLLCIINFKNKKSKITNKLKTKKNVEHN